MTSSQDQQGPQAVEDPDGPIMATGLAELPILSHKPGQLTALNHSVKREWAFGLGILAIASVLFLPNLGAFGLWDPWETHYGEVTRYMIETGDWVHPWWGYKGEKFGGEKGPGEHFYSKPILIFWMEAATISAIGLSELAIRLPMALIAMLTVLIVYMTFSRLLGPVRGAGAAIVLGTCPQFYFLARQAQTDMPFVGTLTIAMCFFCLAVFSPRRPVSDRYMWLMFWATVGAILLTILPQLGIISADVQHPPPVNSRGESTLMGTWRYTGLWQAATYLVVLIPLVISMIQPVVRHYKANNGAFDDGFKDQLQRKCYLWLFYTFCALSFMAKGLLGFALPGLIILLYLLIGNEWSLLAQRHNNGWRGRVELTRGLLIFMCVGLPWYVALLSGPEGRAFWNRFFIHDHFNRLGAGVHAIDDGTFEHFLKWLGFGMWPWAAFVPTVLLLVSGYKLSDRTPKNRMKLFMFLWFLAPYSLFTMSSTKFHHYIFPALPPLAMMVAWSLYDIVKDRTWLGRVSVAVALALFATLTWDISRNPQHLRNLFTYKYDRELPNESQRPTDPDGPIKFNPSDRTDWEPKQTWAEGDFYKHTPPSLHAVLETPLFHYKTWIMLIAGLGGLALMLMLGAGRLRLIGLTLLVLMATTTTCWALNFYMGMLAPHWSQKYLFDKYYDSCVMAPNSEEIETAFTPVLAETEFVQSWVSPRSKQVCQEEVISWLLTWRGETFYSHNTIRPIQKEKTQFQPYLKEINKGARFFVHIERTRAKSFKARAESNLKKLSKHRDFKGIKGYNVTLEHNENYWFVLLKADPICKKGYSKDQLGRCLPQSAKSTTGTDA